MAGFFERFRRRREPERIEPETEYREEPTRREDAGCGGPKKGDLETLLKDFVDENLDEWHDVRLHKSTLNPPKGFKGGFYIADHKQGPGSWRYLVHVDEKRKVTPVTSTHEELADAVREWLNG
jgi:hypothetical protein